MPIGQSHARDIDRELEAEEGRQWGSEEVEVSSVADSLPLHRRNSRKGRSSSVVRTELRAEDRDDAVEDLVHK